VTTEGTEPARPPAQPEGRLYVKLLEAIRGLERVPERGWNDAQSYSYVREEDLVDAVRDRIVAAGLLILPSLESIEDRQTQRVDRQTGAVTPGWPITRVVMRYKIVEAETGQYEELRFPGDGSDGGDKGVYKALTGALKYMLRQPFLIATGDDAESSTEGQAAHARPSSGPAPSARPPAAGQARGGGGGRTASEGQQRMMYARAKSHGLTDAERDAVLVDVAGVATLEQVPMSAVDNVLAAFADPRPTGQSDVPGPGPGEFEHAPVPAGAGAADDDIPF
jgi:hypothetical protein